MPKPRCKPASGIKDTLASTSKHKLGCFARLPCCDSCLAQRLRLPTVGLQLRDGGASSVRLGIV